MILLQYKSKIADWEKFKHLCGFVIKQNKLLTILINCKTGYHLELWIEKSLFLINTIPVDWFINNSVSGKMDSTYGYVVYYVLMRLQMFEFQIYKQQGMWYIYQFIDSAMTNVKMLNVFSRMNTCGCTKCQNLQIGKRKKCAPPKFELLTMASTPNKSSLLPPVISLTSSQQR